MASSLYSAMLAVMCCVFILQAKAVSSIPSREFDSMLHSLRDRGYDLFCNALITSDLQFEVLSYQSQNQNQRNGQQEQEQERTTTTTTNNNNNNNNRNHSGQTFTFFAPTDASLFALDMTQTASSYTDTLRLHVVPRRLSVAELRILPDGYALPTLLPERRLDVMRSTAYAAGVSVGGVEIAFPGLFYGHHIAVHGLAGILSLRSNAVPGVVAPSSPLPVAPPISSIDRRWRTIPNFPENQTILPPSFRPVRTVPKSVSFNVTRQRRPNPQVVAPVPRSSPVRRQAPTPVHLDASRQAPAPVHHAASRQAPAPVPLAVSRQAPAPVPTAASSPAPCTSPVNVTVDAPAPGPEADWIIHSSPSLDEDPVVSPAVSAPMFPDSEITLPPEGFSEVTVPAPAAMELLVWENHIHNVSIKEASGDLEGVMETSTETPQALDGVRKCDLGVGVKDDHGDFHIMQCYAS